MLPNSDAGTDDCKRIYRNIVIERNLTGAANSTKWNELIEYYRSIDGWRPSYRSKIIDGCISDWDSEWFYHLPFPFICVEWFDIGLHQILTYHRIAPKKVIDHTQVISELVKKIGFEYEVRRDVLRIWGYLPKDFTDF